MTVSGGTVGSALAAIGVEDAAMFQEAFADHQFKVSADDTIVPCESVAE